MSVMELVVAMMVAGSLLWLVNRSGSRHSRFKAIFNVAVVAGAALWLLLVTGILGDLVHWALGGVVPKWSPPPRRMW